MTIDENIDYIVVAHRKNTEEAFVTHLRDVSFEQRRDPLLIVNDIPLGNPTTYISGAISAVERLLINKPEISDEELLNVLGV